MTVNADTKNLFKSERLVYEAFDDSKDDKDFIHELLADPVNQSFADIKVRKPVSQKDVEKHMQLMSSSIMCFKICLSPAESQAFKSSNQQQEQQLSAGEEEKKDGKPEEKDGSKKKGESLTPIGFLAFFNLGEDSIYTRHHRNATLGISLLEEFRGKGYGGEVLNWGLDWAFISAGLHRVTLQCLSFNFNAIKLYRKVGFVEEGRQREAVYFERAWYDVLEFSILEQEWEKLRGLK